MGCIPSLLKSEDSARSADITSKKARDSLENDVEHEREKLKTQQRRLLLGQTEGVPHTDTSNSNRNGHTDEHHDGEVSSRTETCSDFDLSSEDQYSVNELVNIKKSHVDYRKRSVLTSKNGRNNSKRKNTSNLGKGGSSRLESSQDIKEDTGPKNAAGGPKRVTTPTEKKKERAEKSSEKPTVPPLSQQEQGGDLSRRNTNDMFDFHKQKLTHQEKLRRTFPTRPLNSTETTDAGGAVPHPPPLSAAAPAANGKGANGALANGRGNSLRSQPETEGSSTDTPMGMGFHNYHSDHVETPAAPGQVPPPATATVATVQANGSGTHSSGSPMKNENSGGSSAGVTTEKNSSSQKAKAKEDDEEEDEQDVASEPPDADGVQTMDNELDALMNQNNSLAQGDKPFGTAAPASTTKTDSYVKSRFSFHVPEYNLEGSVLAKKQSQTRPPNTSTTTTTTTKNGEAEGLKEEEEEGEEKTLTFQNKREKSDTEKYKNPLTGEVKEATVATDATVGDPNMYFIDKYVNKSMSQQKKKPKKKTTDYDLGFAL